jgi:glycosyltransferase involved in cell wall biosynthesis
VSGDVTVVVPAYGGADRLQTLLDALAAQSEAAGGSPLAVVVADDCSPTPLADLVEAPAGLSLELVRAARNGGPGAARNLGLPLVRTGWVAFLDSDTVPAPGWLDALGRVVADGRLDVVEGPVEIPGEATPFTHATEAHAPGLSHVSCNLALRTETLRRIGGFDERFYDPSRKLHFREDTDLFFRLEDDGCAIGWEPGLVVTHPPLPASFAAPLRLSRRYHFDPLLAREHPQRFEDFVGRRRLGPVTLRAARHDAALLAVGGSIVAVGGAAAGSRGVAALGTAAAAAGWLGTACGLAWGRRVRAADVVPLAAVSAVVPWVYAWHYYRGVARFRHRPRL